MSTLAQVERRFPIGAEPQGTHGVHFRVWAPKRQTVEVIFEDGLTAVGEPTAYPLAREDDGYHATWVPEAAVGTRYRFRLDGSSSLFPDPSSRYQPEGPFGPSEVVDPTTYVWHDPSWEGVSLAGQIIYELHIGTFTPEGTWKAAIARLPHLRQTGITTIEVMPVAEFPGQFGWGYDGVYPFAPTRLYGTPDDFRAFVDAAHVQGMGIILDVVYNHIGPSGNFFTMFAAEYFATRYTTEWGEAINFDGDSSGPVREYFLTNAAYWVSEFHLDGLRLDATQSIYDVSEQHFLAVLSQRVAQAAGHRRTIIVSENERQEAVQLRSLEHGGYGLSAAWNDDFHHSAIVALTGRNEFYYADYRGTPQELISALKWGYLFQGQWTHWHKRRRGTPAFDISAPQFITFLENHDQVANSVRGERVRQRTSPGRYRALTALFLLAPSTPMLFQGQEFGSTRPFYYFADHEVDLAKLVQTGRSTFLRQFRSAGCDECHPMMLDPASPETFELSKVDWDELDRNSEWLALHRELICLRKNDRVFSAQRADRMHGAVLAPEAFLLRMMGENGDDRLIIVNLGPDLRLDPAPEPLLAHPLGSSWELLWSSEDPEYGGSGTPPLESEEYNWTIPGHSTVVLRPQKMTLLPDLHQQATLETEEENGQ